MVSWTQSIQSTGPIGWLFYMGLYAICCLLFVPCSVLTLVAGTVYGFWRGLALVLIGNGLGSLLSLWVTRYLFHGWAEKYFSRSPRMRALQTAVEKGGWKIVCLTHLSPIMPFGAVNYAFGLTRIPALEFLIATEIGTLPSACVYVYAGTLLSDLAKIGAEPRHAVPLEWLLETLGLVATVVLAVYLSRMASQVLKQEMN